MLGRILILFALFFSLSVVAGASGDKEYEEFVIDPGIKFVAGKKCSGDWSTTSSCKNSTHYIIRDVNGVPVSVSDVNSCEGKRVTWTYDPATVGEDALGAPKFALLFYPEYPGNNPKSSWSEDFVGGDDKNNQEYTLKTKKLKKSDEPECINYMVIIPTKGILDPVFIIDQ